MSKRDKIYKVSGDQQHAQYNSSQTNQSAPTAPSSSLDRIGTNFTRTVSNTKPFSGAGEAESGTESKESARINESKQQANQPEQDHQIQFSEMNEMQQIRFMIQKRDKMKSNYSRPSRFTGLAQKRQFQQSSRRSKFCKQDQRGDQDNQQHLSDESADSNSNINNTQYHRIQTQKINQNDNRELVQKPQIKRRFFSDVVDNTASPSSISADETTMKMPEKSQIKNSMYQPRQIDETSTNQRDLADTSNNLQQQNTGGSSTNIGNYGQNRRSFNRQISQFGLKNINDDKIRAVNKMDVDSSDYCSASQSEEQVRSNRQHSGQQLQQVPSEIDKFQHTVQQSNSNNLNDHYAVPIYQQSQLKDQSNQQQIDAHAQESSFQLLQQVSGTQSTVMTPRDDNKNNTIGQLTDSLVSVGREAITQHPNKTHINLLKDQHIYGKYSQSQIIDQQLHRKKLRDVEHLQRSHYTKIDTNRSNELTGSGSEGLVADFHINNFTNTIGHFKQQSISQQDLMGSQFYQSHVRERQFEQVPQPNYAQQTPPMLSRSTSSNQTAEFGNLNSNNCIEIVQEKDDNSKLITIQDNSVVKQNHDNEVVSTKLPVESQKRSVYMQQVCQKEQQNSPQRNKSQFSKNIISGRFNQEDEMSDEESSNQDELSDRQDAIKRRNSKQGNSIRNEEELRFYNNNSNFKHGTFQEFQNENFKLNEQAVIESQNALDHHDIQQNNNFQQSLTNDNYGNTPHKYVDRYVGNIAESDEDYDDESEDDEDQSQMQQEDSQAQVIHSNTQNNQTQQNSIRLLVNNDKQLSDSKLVLNLHGQSHLSNYDEPAKSFQNMNKTKRDDQLPDNNMNDIKYSIQSNQSQPLINSIIDSSELVKDDVDNNVIMSELGQKLEPRLGPLKKDHQLNKISQFSPFNTQIRNDLQQPKDTISYNDAGSSLSSEQLSKDVAGKDLGNNLPDDDEDEEENDEEEYNLPDELIDTGKDSIPKSLATTINNQSLNNMMSPSRLIDSKKDFTSKEQVLPRDSNNINKPQSIVEHYKTTQKQFPQSASNRNSFTTIFSQFKKLGHEEEQQPTANLQVSNNNNSVSSQQAQVSLTPQMQSIQKFNHYRKYSYCDKQNNHLPQDFKQSKEASKYFINFPMLSSSRQQAMSQKSQLSNWQGDIHSNYSQSKKDSNSNNDEYNSRNEQRTYMATQGGSVNQSNAANNACGLSLSSMKEQFKNDLTINNSPKALTTNSHKSQEKQSHQVKQINKRAFQSSAHAKTLDEKLQILHSNSQGMNLQTNLANISNMNQATKGSNSINSEAKSISAISINFMNARDGEVLSDKQNDDSRRMSINKGQQKFTIQHNNFMPSNVVKPNIRIAEKLNQKIIDDNFNYYTEQTEMQSQSYQTLPPEDEFKNLQQYIDKQQSRSKESQYQSHHQKAAVGIDGTPQQISNSDDVVMKESESGSLPVIDLNVDLLNNTNVPFYPDFVNNNKTYSEDFTKQFQDIISTKLKKKIKNLNNLADIQAKLAPKMSQNLRVSLGNSEEMDTVKRTLILTIDDCFLKTSIFKEELPHVDATFTFKNLKVHVCFRQYLKEFIHEVKKYYEVIAWTSSQLEYSDQLIKIIEDKLDFKFDLSLSIQDQVASEDQLFYVKNIDILCGQQQNARLEKNIIMVDSQMSNFTNKLTNGLYLPPIRFSSTQESDMCLKSLLKYLTSFVLEPNEKDVRNVIKIDFDLLNRFNNNKQCLAFQKILRRTVEESSESALVNIGVSGQKQIIQKLRDNSKKTIE